MASRKFGGQHSDDRTEQLLVFVVPSTGDTRAILAFSWLQQNTGRAPESRHGLRSNLRLLSKWAMISK